MSNKVAIVTGASKGLGYYIVKGLCERFSGTVYLTSRDQTRGLEACKQLEKDGLKPAYHQLDVTDKKSAEDFVKFIKEKHGRIDVLVNNAGILFLKDSKESKFDQAFQTMETNFFSLVNFTELTLPLFQNGGIILNISSSSGHLSRIPSEELRSKICSKDINLEKLVELFTGYVEDVKEGKEVEIGWGESPYVVSKVGVNAYTFLLHRKLVGKGVTVNCVHPGYVQSDMTRGSGNVSPGTAAETPLRLVLDPTSSGTYVWSNGLEVPWDGEDPRVYIDGKSL